MTTTRRVHPPRVRVAIGAMLLTALLPLASIPRCPAQNQIRVIEILADKDSRYKIAQKTSPTLKFKTGEEKPLKIMAHKAQTFNRNVPIHGFALIRKKDGAK